MKSHVLSFLLFVLMATPAALYAQIAPETEPNNTAGTANILAPGDTVSGAVLGTESDIDWFAVTTTGDGILKLNYSGTGAGSVYLRIYDDNGTTVLASSTVSSASSSSIQYNKAAAGNYYFQVDYYNSSTDATYELSAELIEPLEANDAETNDSKEEAVSWTENATTEGHIGYRANGGTFDSDDWYSFTTTDDGTIELSITQDITQYFRIYLYDSNGTTVLASGSDYGSVVISRSGLAAGNYYAKVNYYSSSYYGGYTLENTVIPTPYANDAEPNNVYTEALTIAENGSVNGHIGFRYNGGTYDANDWYTLVTTSDGTISAELINDDGMYHSVYLYASNGITILSSSSAYDTVNIMKTGMAAGTYYVRVSYYSTAYYGSYTLSNTITPTEYVNDLEPNGTYLEALTLPENDSVYGHIGHRYDDNTYDALDWYQLTTTNDGTITVVLENNTGQYHTVTLYDSNGTTSLGSNSAYGTQTVITDGLAAGTYYVRVSYYSTAYFSGYKLSNTVTPPMEANDAEPNGSIAEAVPMLTNSSVEGHIGFRGNGSVYDANDYYEIVISQPGDITLELDFDTDAYHRVYLYNEGGSSLGSSVGYDSISLVETGLAAGTYYALVNYYSSTYHSGYTLKNTYCPDTIVIVAEGTTTLCEGESVLLSTEDNHWSYLWSDGSTTATNAAVVTDGFSLTIDNGGGCVRTSNIIDVDVTPNPVAIIDLDGPAAFCDGGSVTLSISSDAPDAYLWSTGETTPTIEVTTSGDYSVELFKGLCSAISDPVAITVFDNPVAEVTPSGATTFCDGESVTLDAGAASEYLWSTGETTSSIEVSSTGSYSVTITDGNGCTDVSEDVDVTVNPIPVATVTPDGPTEFCEGGSVTLTASAADSYLWSTGEASASIVVSTSGTYNVEVTSLGCSALSGDELVTVNSLPTATISADGPTTFCDGESVTLTASSGDSYLWSTGETSASIVVTTDGSYTVTVFSAEGCSNESSATLVTVTTCTEDLVITADGPVEFCEGESVTLSSNLATGNVWSTGETTMSIIVTETGDYSCTNDAQTSNTISVTVNALPIADISPSGTIELCVGETVLLTASGGDSYLWDGGETTESIDVGAGEYSVTVTNAAGCAAVAGPVSVNESASPTVDILSPLMEKICYEGSTTLEASVSSGDIQWQRNGVDIPGANASTYVADMTGTYTCIADNGVCPPVESASILIGNMPVFTLITSGIIYICDGDLTTLAAPYSGSATYQWYRNNVAIGGAVSNTYETGMEGKYFVVVTRDGCSLRSKNALVIYDCRMTNSLSASIGLYPNPANTTAYLQVVSAVSGSASLHITNMQGSVVYSEILEVEEGNQAYQLPVADLADGVYLVHFVQDGQDHYEQLIIQK